MIIIKKPNAKILKAVAEELKCGSVIVYPTDTAYGLGCDATNAHAVARIFKIKGREKGKALPMICADLKMAKKFFLLPTPYSLLTKKHWPGPLSIVVKALPARQAGKKGIAPMALEAGTAAVRVPDSRVACALSKLLGRPIIATSANLSGAPTCYSISSFLHQGFGSEYVRTKRGLLECKPRRARASSAASADIFADKPNLTSQNRRDALSEGRGYPDLILNAGALPHRRPSTIIKIGKNGNIELLRKGPIVP